MNEPNSKPGLQVLLVDDEAVIHKGLAPYLRDLGHEVDDAYDGEQALAMISDHDYDLALVDVQMPKMDGIALLAKAAEIQPDLACVIISAHGDMDLVIKALRLGAADFLPKPVKLTEVDAVIEKAVRFRDLRGRERRARVVLGGVQDSAYHWRTGQRLVGSSPAMEQVRELIRAAVEAQLETILIQGETGTGKEVVAREIHLLGKQEGSPFIAVSCPALPESLVEAELFGHVKGSFTGATSDRAGYFEMADNGTLFLDEIADLAPNAQAKLLRVLETRTTRRVGGKKEVKVNVCVVAATNSSLHDLVRNKQFRQDLLYRLNVYTIVIPPLRERRDDIVPLAEHFLESFVKSKRLPVTGFSEQARQMLTQYDFPGNARELRNLTERAAILARQELIQTQHLWLDPASAAETAHPDGYTSEDREKQEIIDVLERVKWNRSRAAGELKISYATLRYRMKKFDISL